MKKSIENLFKDVDITDQTDYWCRKLYGKMPLDMLKRPKELEKETVKVFPLNS